MYDKERFQVALLIENKQNGNTRILVLEISLHDPFHHREFATINSLELQVMIMNILPLKPTRLFLLKL